MPTYDINTAPLWVPEPPPPTGRRWWVLPATRIGIVLGFALLIAVGGGVGGWIALWLLETGEIGR